METYGRGVDLIQKMGCSGVGGLGPSGEGIWFPPQTSTLPKYGVDPFLGGESSLPISSISGSVILGFPSFVSPLIQNPPTTVPISSDVKKKVQVDMGQIQLGSEKKKKVMSTVVITNPIPTLTTAININPSR